MKAHYTQTPPQATGEPFMVESRVPLARRA